MVSCSLCTGPICWDGNQQGHDDRVVSDNECQAQLGALLVRAKGTTGQDTKEVLAVNALLNQVHLNYKQQLE